MGKLWYKDIKLLVWGHVFSETEHTTGSNWTSQLLPTELTCLTIMLYFTSDSENISSLLCLLASNINISYAYIEQDTHIPNNYWKTLWMGEWVNRGINNFY